MSCDDQTIISTTTALTAVATSGDDFIKSRIFTIRGVQVILDRDLAVLYGVDVKRINEQVKRNADRFPEDFMFHLSKEECLRSQIATLNMERGKHLKYMPYAFTESGVAMLSGVLRSSIAIDVNIRIMRAFVSMRKSLASIAPVLARMAEVERLQLEEKTTRIADQHRNEERFDKIFKAMDGGDFPPQKVFFDGKHFDAFSFARKLVRKATKSIVLVDAYCDDVTLDILSQKRGCASLTIATSQKSETKFLWKSYSVQRSRAGVRTSKRSLNLDKRTYGFDNRCHSCRCDHRMVCSENLCWKTQGACCE